MVGLALDRCDADALSRADRRAPRNGCKACRAAMAAGAPSMPTTPTTISTTFPSPIMARCSIRRPTTSRRAASVSGQLGGHDDQVLAARHRLICAASRKADGCWFGRWGTNYIYGTWSVLVRAQRCGRRPKTDPMIRSAAAWLLSKQRADGGWGEDGASYWPDQPHGESRASTASQTAWALLALMAAGEAEHPAVARGVAFLLATSSSMASGTKRNSLRSVSRASSICAITAIAPISRCGRWRAIAISPAAITPPIPTACR